MDPDLKPYLDETVQSAKALNHSLKCNICKKAYDNVKTYKDSTVYSHHKGCTVVLTIPNEVK